MESVSSFIHIHLQIYLYWGCAYVFVWACVVLDDLNVCLSLIKLNSIFFPDCASLTTLFLHTNIRKVAIINFSLPFFLPELQPKNVFLKGP